MEESLIDNIHYFRLPVVDLTESVNWYTECLGFKLLHNRGDLAVIELRSGPLLVLVQADKHSRGHFTINDQLEFSVGFTTSKIEELHNYFSEKGVKVDDLQEDNGHYFFHFFDPSGNKLQVHN